MEGTTSKSPFYHGKVLVLSNSSYHNQSHVKPEHLFFDKSGRQKSMISVGPAKLIDCIYGREHKNSVPQLGEILIGLKVENADEKKSKLSPFVFRSWSMNGKLMLELSRMVQYGTKMSDLELRPMFRQIGGCIAQKILNSSPLNDNLILKQSAKCIDDFYVLIKMILWGNMRLLAVMYSLQSNANLVSIASVAEIDAALDLKISCNAFEYVQSMSTKLQDETITTSFLDLFSNLNSNDVEPSQTYTSPSSSSQTYTSPSSSSNRPLSSTSNMETAQYNPSSPVYPPSTAQYNPSSPVYPQSTVEYNPSSPVYPISSLSASKDKIETPSSPLYVSTSPIPPPHKNIPTSISAPAKLEEEEESTSPLYPCEDDGPCSPVDAPPSNSIVKKSRWADASVSQIVNVHLQNIK